eukprot:CAMPEP_0117010868 /NCGR_PEP_ID=MMETSP0472-20121206/9471_1 /TAXON_ID=693140 ORGANISM="Tiarina fusus, Strain LIS" /NCGR_SAMPLE_ID=MMETSP0472 /ASSEMBLY_ACC=CAM_ASM_000603 /LENGTH=692 /DNA_ID=CAMNT_0004713513 /DNA_START=114 /DNA_END=2192 /DNA_ORIENTATION=+
MKHQDELFFPCLETPKRCFLTSLIGGGSSSSTPSTSSSGHFDEHGYTNHPPPPPPPPQAIKNLSCNRQGSLSISNNNNNNFTEWEEWELEPHDEYFALKSVKRNVYLTFESAVADNIDTESDDSDTGTDTTTDIDNTDTNSSTITSDNDGGAPPMRQAVGTCKSFESPHQLWDVKMTTSSEHMGIIVRLRNVATDLYLTCCHQNNDNSNNNNIKKDSNTPPYKLCLTTTTNDASTNTMRHIGYPPSPEVRHEAQEQTLWRVEFQTGELCFLSNPTADRRLKCNVFGHLSLESNENNNWKGWEVWRFIDVGNYELLITSWTHTTRVLASNWAGKVVTTEDRHGFGTRWRVMKGIYGNGVLLQSVETGRYLRVVGDQGCDQNESINKSNNNNNNNNVSYDFNTVDRPEEFGTEWQLESANKNVFYLLGRGNDKLLSCTRNGGTKLGNRPTSWEEWRVAKVLGTYNNKYEIYSTRFKRYLGVDHRGDLVVTNEERNSISDLWEIEVSATGGYIITSTNIMHPGRLCYDVERSCWTVSSAKHEDCEWSLHPKMPESISGPQLGVMVGAGVGALALTVAAPFAVAWGVAAIGFGAEGICAGSAAAAMMSAEAVASGGGIVAGGLVATLQSIGAAGLGVAGTTAAMGGGALLGSAGLGITAAVVGGKDDQDGISAQEPDELEFNSELSRLPLCAWRSW